MIASSHEYSNYAVSACIVAITTKTNWHIGCVEEEHYIVTIIIRTIMGQVVRANTSVYYSQTGVCELPWNSVCN